MRKVTITIEGDGPGADTALAMLAKALGVVLPEPGPTAVTINNVETKQAKEPHEPKA